MLFHIAHYFIIFIDIQIQYALNNIDINAFAA